jgi:spermidine synthase
VAKLFVAERRDTLARAYAIESVGGILGGAAATLALRVGFQNFTIAAICSLLALLSAVHRAGRDGRRDGPGRFLSGLSAVAGIVLLAILWQGGTIDRWSTGWNHPALLATCDTPYGRITMSGRLGQVSVFENGALAFDSEGTSAEELVHLAAIEHPDPRSILILGGSLEGLAREAERHRPERIDVLELDRRAFDLARRHLPGDPLQVPGATRARVRFADPRRHLREFDRRAYDLILVGMPEPTSAEGNRFYTREFFAQCAEWLSPGGVVAFRLRSAENLWTPLLLRRARSIQRALGEVFPEIIVLPGVTNIFIGSLGPLERDPEKLASRLEERGIEARMVSPAYVRYVHTNPRFAEAQDRLAATSAPVNSDARPICYQYTLLLWLSRYYPVLTLIDLPERIGPWGARAAWLAVVGVLVVLAWLRREPAARRVILVAMAGFLGMVLESALILGYQMRSGVLFQDLGLLLTVFMAGLALGSFSVHRWARRGSDGGGLSRWLGAGLLAAFAGLSTLCAVLLSGVVAAGIGLTALALLLCGGLVAAVFAYASLRRISDQRLVVSPLYAADLIGGCLGSLAGSLILIPILGLGDTALAMLVVAAAALIVV